MIPSQFMKPSVKLYLPAYHYVTVHIFIMYKEILRVQNFCTILISSQNKIKEQHKL